MKTCNNCPYYNVLIPYCEVLFLRASSIAEKSKALIKLDEFWSIITQQKADVIYNGMCYNCRGVLEKFWEIRKPVPHNKQWWKEGIKGNGRVYFPDDKVFKTARGGEKSWRDIIDCFNRDFNKNNDGGVTYRNCRIDLSEYCIASVKVRFEDSPNIKRGGGKGVQDLAAKEFEKYLKNSYQKQGFNTYWEFKDGVNSNGDIIRETPLVPHEDYDAETIMLVPKDIHDNCSHYGGISLARLVSRIGP